MSEPSLFESIPDQRHGHLGERLWVTPYNGTSGWSGSDTSRERAEQADADGTTSERQTRVLALLHGAGEEGLTWRELSQLSGWHHGSASGVLSVLHKVGLICRLSQRRNKMKVYVDPEFVAGRETEPHGRIKAATVHKCSHCGHEEVVA